MRMLSTSASDYIDKAFAKVRPWTRSITINA